MVRLCATVPEPVVMRRDGLPRPGFRDPRRNLWCWHCRKDIPDTNPECGTCLWRTCSCGACRQPIHRDSRGRIGTCPAEVSRFGDLFLGWTETFDGMPIVWPSRPERAAGSAVRSWLDSIERDLGIRIRLRDTQGYHKTFGLRLEVPGSIDLIADARIPVLLRGASNLSGDKNVIIERAGGGRVTFVLGEGVFSRVDGVTREDHAIRDAVALEQLESRGRGLGDPE